MFVHLYANVYVRESVDRFVRVSVHMCVHGMRGRPGMGDMCGDMRGMEFGLSGVDSGIDCGKHGMDYIISGIDSGMDGGTGGVDCQAGCGIGRAGCCAGDMSVMKRGGGLECRTGGMPGADSFEDLVGGASSSDAKEFGRRAAWLGALFSDGCRGHLPRAPWVWLPTGEVYRAKYALSDAGRLWIGVSLGGFANKGREPLGEFIIHGVGLLEDARPPSSIASAASS